MIKGRRGELVVKDYMLMVLLFSLLVVSVMVIMTDMSKNEDISEDVDISELEKFYDKEYIDETSEKTQKRLSEFEDAGFFKTTFLTTLEIVWAIPNLVRMTARSMGVIVGLLSSSAEEGAIPSDIIMVISIILYASLLWAVVYFIRRISK